MKTPLLIKSIVFLFFIVVMIALVTACQDESVERKRPSGDVITDYTKLHNAFADASRKAKAIVDQKKTNSQGSRINPDGDGFNDPVDEFEDANDNTFDGFVPFTEEEAVEIVQPLLEPSAAFLNSYYEINIYEYFAPGDPRIAEIGSIAMELKNMEDQGITVDTVQYENWLNTAPLFNGARYDDEPGSLLSCALDALGVPAGMVGAEAKNLSRKAILKAIRKVATRTLGFIGAAIAVYEFGDCMDWW